jgi:hypothetical protein
MSGDIISHFNRDIVLARFALAPPESQLNIDKEHSTKHRRRQEYLT